MFDEARIAHITTVHEPFDPRIFHKQLQSLREAGFGVHLVAPYRETVQRQGVSIHALPIPSGYIQRLSLQALAFRRARRLDAALYQVHDPELLPMAFLLKKTTGADIVYDMHEDYRTKGAILGRALRGLERWAFQWLDHVLLAEESYRSIAEGNVSHTLLPNYVRPLDEKEEFTASLTDRDSPTRLLYTGTISVDRGLRTMIHLATYIRQQEWPGGIDMVGICGHPSQRAWAERQIRRGELEEVVVRTGWNAYVRPSAMTQHYHRADVGLALCEPCPNYVGSIPTKFYEYLHYGLPIICSDIPLWRQFVERNECGVAVPPGDPTAVIEVIQQWRADPVQYRQYVHNAFKAASKYRWESVEGRLISLYRRLLREPSQSIKTRR